MSPQSLLLSTRNARRRDGSPRRTVSSDRNAKVVRAISVVVLLIAWEVLGRLSNPVLFAPPSKVAVAVGNMVLDGTLLPAIGTSGLDLIFGFVPAVLVGIPIGLIAGRNRIVREMTSPYFTVLLTLPMIALTPLVLFAFGIGQEARSALIFAFCLAQIMVNTAVGAGSVPRERLEMAAAFRIRGVAALRRVIIPSASPAIFAGLRLGMGQAVIGVIVAELTVSPVGLGGLLTQFAARYRTDQVLATVVAIGVVSVLIFRLMGLLERRATRWSMDGD